MYSKYNFFIFVLSSPTYQSVYRTKNIHLLFKKSLRQSGKRISILTSGEDFKTYEILKEALNYDN